MKDKDFCFSQKEIEEILQNSSISRIKDFLKEIADPENECEYGTGDLMHEDAKTFLKYVEELEKAAWDLLES